MGQPPAAGTWGQNVLGNGRFAVWEGYVAEGVTTTSVGVPPNSIPQHWYGGPGVGATATYGVVELNADNAPQALHGQRALRVAWSAAPGLDWPGETHHVPDFRFSFLENFCMADVRILAGKRLLVGFWGRVAEGELTIAPILWQSFGQPPPGETAQKGRNYELYESAGEAAEVAVAEGKPRDAAACLLTTEWQYFERVIVLPDVEGRTLGAGHYTGAGFDIAERAAPTIELADVSVRPAE